MQNPIWKFESDLTNHLLLWGILSLLSGLYIWFVTNKLDAALAFKPLRGGWWMPSLLYSENHDSGVHQLADGCRPFHAASRLTPGFFVKYR